MVASSVSADTTPLIYLTILTCSCVSPTASASSAPGEAVQRGGGVTVADVEEHLANLRQYSKIRWEAACAMVRRSSY